MKTKKIMMMFLALFVVFTISACADNNDGTNTDKDKEAAQEENENTDKEATQDENKGMDNLETDHSEMEHASSGEVPENLKVAENPKYEIGSKAIINAGHMNGMKGAEATIVGAYDTIAYVISYTPSDGGERVENHKWVIQEEIPEADDDIPLKPGAKVTINAEHMPGMDGATAEIDSAENTTVYMINFTPTTGGDEVKNHKWVTESELSPIK